MTPHPSSLKAKKALIDRTEKSIPVYWAKLNWFWVLLWTELVQATLTSKDTCPEQSPILRVWNACTKMTRNLSGISMESCLFIQFVCVYLWWRELKKKATCDVQWIICDVRFMYLVFLIWNIFTNRRMYGHGVC